MTTTGHPSAPPSPLTALVPEGETLHAVLERTYRAPRPDVWAAWTTPDRLARWLGTPSGDLTPGGSYRLVLGDGDDEFVTGTVVACEPPARLVATWVLPDERATEVEVTLDEHDGDTLLRLEHRGLPPAQARGYAAGWHVYADDLAAHLSGERPAGTWEERFDAILPTYRSVATTAAVTRGDRGALRFTRRLATDLADAWTLVSDPERVARWFAPVTVGDPEAPADRGETGHAVGRGWSTSWDDGREYASGTVTRCEPPHVLELTWTATDDADSASADSVLRVRLSEDADGVLLVLEHEGLGARDLVLYGAGWHTYLDRLGDGSVTEVDWSARFGELEPLYRRLVG